MSRTTKRRAIGYVRISRVFAGEVTVSPEQQLDDITSWCRQQRIELVDVVTDIGLSAGEGKRRPGYDEVRRRLRAGEATMLVCYKLDRVSRSVLDFGMLMKELREHDCEFASVSENLDTTSAMGEAFVMITMVFAQLERARAVERNTATARHRRSKGAAPGGPTPYGLRRVGSTFEIVDEQAEIVELCARAVENGVSLSALARQLTDDGVPGPTHGRAVGRWVSNSTIVGILRTPSIAALIRTQESDESDVEFVEGAWDAIIAPERWHELQRLLSDPNRRTRKSSTPTLTGGIVKCAVCSSAMRPKLQRWKDKRYNYLKCENACVAVDRDVVEQLIERTLLARFGATGVPALDESTSRCADVAHLRELADVLFEQATSGEITAADYARRSAALETKIAAAEQREIAAPDAVVLRLAGASDLAAEWPALDVLERRAIIAHVFDSIVVHPAERYDGSSVESRVEIDGVRCVSMTDA